MLADSDVLTPCTVKSYTKQGIQNIQPALTSQIYKTMDSQSSMKLFT